MNQVPNKITVHCSDSPNGKYYSRDQIERDHIARGFSTIGYHLVFQPDGQVDQGRGFNEVGAHVQGENIGNLGFCLIGTDRFTSQQWAALRSKIDAVMMIYQIPAWELYPHCFFKSAQAQGKTCPNVPHNVLMGWYIGHYEAAIKPFTL